MKTKKINFSKIILSTMLLLLCFCVCGCASVNFVTYHNNDGSINEYVYLTINEQSLTEHGYNIDATKLEIQTNSYFEANLLLTEYKNKITQEYNNNTLTDSEYTILYNGINVIGNKWTKNEYLIGLQFKNSTIYKKYYELLNNITFNSKPKQVKKLFYTKTYHYGTTNYGDYSIFARIYNYYSNTIFSTISPQETSLTYSYSVSTHRFHSDADKVYTDSNGNYIHTWNVNPSNPDEKICFYTISANRSVWIITCIAIGLLICLTLCIIGLIKYKKHKNTTLELNEKNDTENIE